MLCTDYKLRTNYRRGHWALSHCISKKTHTLWDKLIAYVQFVDDPGWVSQRVDSHLGIYLSKFDNIKPLCGKLCLLWIVACLQFRVSVTCISCGMQPSHLNTFALPKPQDLLELGWHDCKILKFKMKSFGNFRGALRKTKIQFIKCELSNKLEWMVGDYFIKTCPWFKTPN